MNEEYLWDKTGSDAGIEKLENALHTFSYRPMPPPELPSKVMTLAETPRRSFFKLGFAMAFATAVAVLLSAAWFFVPNRNIAVYNESVKVADQKHDVIAASIETPPDSVNISIGKTSPQAIRATHPRVRPTKHFMQTTAVKVREKQPAVNLTAEEKYAYGQLMLALSITESKLKIVRDAVAGNEEVKTSVEKGKNLYQK